MLVGTMASAALNDAHTTPSGTDFDLYPRSLGVAEAMAAQQRWSTRANMLMLATAALAVGMVLLAYWGREDFGAMVGCAMLAMLMFAMLGPIMYCRGQAQRQSDRSHKLRLAWTQLLSFQEGRNVVGRIDAEVDFVGGAVKKYFNHVSPRLKATFMEDEFFRGHADRLMLVLMAQACAELLAVHLRVALDNSRDIDTAMNGGLVPDLAARLRAILRHAEFPHRQEQH